MSKCIKMASSLVVGGGFVGLSCALHLQRLGRRVRLLDRHAIPSPGAASFGNAGTMAVYANVPVNSPSIFCKLPSMLLDRNAPLSIKLTPHLPAMLPWAALFAWHSRPAAVERTAEALGRLLARAEAGYAPVFEQAGVDIDGDMGAHASPGHEAGSDGVPAAAHRPYAVRQGYLLLQRSEADMRASEAGAALRRRGVGEGLRMQALSQDEVLSLEPNLAPRVCGGGAWFFPDGWFLSEPAALLRALAAGFEAAGGQVPVRARAASLASHPSATPCSRAGDRGRGHRTRHLCGGWRERRAERRSKARRGRGGGRSRSAQRRACGVPARLVPAGHGAGLPCRLRARL